MEFRLSSLSTEVKGFMNENEFCKAIDTFFFVADAKNSSISYRTSLAHSSWDGFDSVPINKLAHILFVFINLF